MEVKDPVLEKYRRVAVAWFAEQEEDAAAGGIATQSNDGPADEDGLGCGGLVKALASVLDDPNYRGKITIGLFGHWGAGKSTVLNLLQDRLKRRETSRAGQKDKGGHKFVFGTFNA